MPGKIATASGPGQGRPWLGVTGRIREKPAGAATMAAGSGACSRWYSATSSRAAVPPAACRAAACASLLGGGGLDNFRHLRENRTRGSEPSGEKSPGGPTQPTVIPFHPGEPGQGQSAGNVEESDPAGGI